MQLLKYYFLIQVVLLALACSGDGKKISSFSPTVNEEITVEGYTVHKSGFTTQVIDEQRTVFKEGSEADFDFFYRLLTGANHPFPEAALQANDVLLVVHTRTNSETEFKISQITDVGGVHFVYFFYDGSTRIGEKEYKIYYLPKNDFALQYVQNVP